MKYKITAGITLAFLAVIQIAGAQTTPAANTTQTPTTNTPQRRARPTPLIEPNAPETKYDYHQLWKPFFYTKNGNEYRAANGEAGSKYWQNRADYQLSAHLNEETNEITGSEVLTYTNNSPQKWISFGCSWIKTCLSWIRGETNKFR